MEDSDVTMILSENPVAWEDHLDNEEQKRGRS